MLIEKLLKYWFVFSLGVLIAFAGWLLNRFGLHPGAALSLVAVLAAAQLFFVLRKKTKKRRRWLPYMRFAILLAAFIAGNFAAENNLYRVNDWMNGSIAYLRSKVQPVRFFDETNGKVTLSANEKIQLKGSFDNLKIFDNDLGSKILVSFISQGLVLLNGKDAIPLNGDGVILHLVEPDNTIYYVNRDGPQVLTKAEIRNNSLYKVWERRTPSLNLNHWGDRFGNLLFIPGRKFVKLPSPLSAQIGYSYGACKDENSRYDVIHVFDTKTGELVRSIDILPVLASIEKDGDAIRQKLNCDDPLHLNSVKIIKDKDHARFFPNGKIGDMLISLRNVNAILLLDRDTLQVKWQLFDKFKLQHEPNITDRGTLLVFDNKGSDSPHGRSRVVEFDIASRKLLGKYEAGDGEFFESYVRGKALPLDDGRVLVQEECPPPNHDATMFVLQCPGKVVSHSCEKQMIFQGSTKLSYENAAFLSR